MKSTRTWIAGALTLALLLVLVPTGMWVRAETDTIVQAGDWLAKIATRQYGDWKLYPGIVLATQAKAATDSSYARISDPWRIEPGSKLSIPSAEDAQAGLTVAKLENAEYPSEWTESGTVKLIDGEYSKEAAPGSASKTTIKLYERMAFGHSDDTPMAAVLLYSSGGGSGTFWDLHAVLDQGGQAAPTAVASLGDRVQVESLGVEGDEIVVQMVTHGPDDPMCCPTQRVRARYGLQGDQLVETSREVIGEGAGDGEAGPGPDSEIVGITWEWERFEGGDDSVIEVNDPTRYTLLLQADGTYSLRADCNTGSGAYTLQGSQLTLEPGPMTLAACPEDSLDSEFLKNLEAVRTYVLHEGKLVLNLFADAGNMIFRPAGSADEPAQAPAADESAGLDSSSITLDTQGLPTSWQANLVPATPYDASQPPGPMGLPEHIQVNFGMTDPQDKQPGDPVMYILPVVAYQQLWEAAGNDAVTRMFEQIELQVIVLPTPARIAGMPALPYEEIGGVNDLSVQVSRVPAKKDSATRNGYRFVSRWAQDANPVVNGNLRYVYQGLTTDGQYLVAFFYPVTTPKLPASSDEVSDQERKQASDDYEAYMQGQAEMLNGLAASDWEPNLETLDAVVASLRIAGMPASGVPGTVWQWESTINVNTGEETAVENPELYTLLFKEGGTYEVRADCNKGSGGYSIDAGMSGAIKMEPGPMTLAQCAEGSRSDDLLNALVATQDFRLRSGGTEFRLVLPAGGGEHVFGPATEQ